MTKQVAGQLRRSATGRAPRGDRSVRLLLDTRSVRPHAHRPGQGARRHDRDGRRGARALRRAAAAHRI